MTSQISYTEIHAHTDFLEAMTEKATDTSLRIFNKGGGVSLHSGFLSGYRRKLGNWAKTV